MRGKVLWAGSLVVLSLLTYWVIGNLEREVHYYDVISGDAILAPDLVAERREEEVNRRNKNEASLFFTEYRLQRARIRGQSKEILREIINNPNTGVEAKAEAERKFLSVVALMEKELLIENIIRAQGYADVVFFYHYENATVMLKAEELSEQESAQITEVVVRFTGLNQETVQVIVPN